MSAPTNAQVAAAQIAVAAATALEPKLASNAYFTAASLAVDTVARATAAQASFGLTEIVPAVIWAVGAFKSKPKDPTEYLPALWKITAKYNAWWMGPIRGTNRVGLLNDWRQCTDTPRGRSCPTPPVHPHELLVQVIQSAEGIPRAQAESLARQTIQIASQTRGVPMALNIGGLLGGIGQAIGGLGSIGGVANPIASGLSNVLQIAGQFIPQPAARPVASVPAVISPTMIANRPMGAMIPRTGLTQEVWNAGTKLLTRLGIGYGASSSGFTSILRRSLSAIGSLARRTPVGTMVSVLAGLGLTVYEANLLTVWHSQRRRGRRMNPANSKALRRSIRRIKSFHKLCAATDILKSRGRRSVGRCGTCRKSPCRC